MTQAEIVVLANSVKHGQHCVAGKCLNTGRWIRPVSNAQGAELSHDQAKYQNPYGTFGVKPLQKIKMGFAQHVPLPHQPENYLIDGNLWQQNYSIGLAELPNHLDGPADLWGEGNRVLHAQITQGLYVVPQSLYLVQVDNLSLYINNDDRRRASFTYNGIDYDLAVTDPKFDELVREQREVTGILCISLGEEYQGYCYKLVATIF
ncbi:dual OB domain-containing protein [Pseudidiomarina sp.]|uniref:dual OB domain-containing protein n=1 Tax=Pseudidiomarina sp. TaxID=2081707 RepID=UPI003A97CACE